MAVLLGFLSTAYLLVFLPDPVSGSGIDIYQAMCPLSDFCTVDSQWKPLIHVTTSRNETSCCLACFCDVNCYVYNDCCPDVDQLRPSPATDNATAKPSCVTALINPRRNPVVSDEDYDRYADRHRMFDSCPSDYVDGEDTVVKCEGTATNFPTSLDDVTLVSDISSRVFRNRYCALCHGLKAHAVMSWKLEVKQCRDQLVDLHLRASEVMSYVLENCLLASTLPETLTINSRLFNCNEVVSTCPRNGSSSETNVRMIEACEKGPYMPFSDNSKKIYKNAFCHLCHSSNDTGVPVCFSDSIWVQRTEDAGLSNLLIFAGGRTNTQSVKCGEEEMYDYHTDMCLEVFCPPYRVVSYGTCQPLITQMTINVKLKMLFVTSETLYVNSPVASYNGTLMTHYLNRFWAMFRGLECNDVDYFVFVHYERASRRFSHLELALIFGTGTKCTVQKLADFVHEQPATLSESWVVNENVVRMKGWFTFFQSQFKEDSSLVYDLVMKRSMGGVRSGHLLYQFFVCPHFIFRPSTYSSAFGRRALGPDGNPPASFGALTETVRKTFALSGATIAVCVDAYLPDRSVALCPHPTVFFLMAISVVGIRVVIELPCIR